MNGIDPRLWAVEPNLLCALPTPNEVSIREMTLPPFCQSAVRAPGAQFCECPRYLTPCPIRTRGTLWIRRRSCGAITPHESKAEPATTEPASQRFTWAFARKTKMVERTNAPVAGRRAATTPWTSTRFRFPRRMTIKAECTDEFRSKAYPTPRRPSRSRRTAVPPTMTKDCIPSRARSVLVLPSLSIELAATIERISRNPAKTRTKARGAAAA